MTNWNNNHIDLFFLNPSDPFKSSDRSELTFYLLLFKDGSKIEICFPTLVTCCLGMHAGKDLLICNSPSLIARPRLRFKIKFCIVSKSGSIAF